MGRGAGEEPERHGLDPTVASAQKQLFLDHLNDRLAASEDKHVTSPQNEECMTRKVSKHDWGYTVAGC